MMIRRYAVPKKIRSLIDFMDAFPDEASCEQHLFTIKYPKGYVCPKCGYRGYSKISKRREYQCNRCRYQESLTKDTAMHNTKIPLLKWFLAIYLMTHDKRGMSALRLSLEIGVAYDTAYRILQRLRGAMADDSITIVLSTNVEVDDAYIGAKGTTRGRGTEKAPFIAAVECSKGGLVSLRAVGSVSGAEYKEFARWHISKTAHIRSDGFPSVRAGLSAWSGHEPKNFDTSDMDASLPVVHNIISNFKAMIIGTYHGVRKTYLQSYMDEYSYRYNNRKNLDIFNALLKDVYLSPRRSKASLAVLFSVQVAETEKKVA